MKVQSKAIARSVRMSPRKIRLLVDMIRGLRVAEAITQLRYSDKAAARPVLKLLASAVANAGHNYGADEASLRVAEVFVDGGAMMKRFSPRAMGRAAPIRHRTAHITIVVAGEATEKKKTEDKPVLEAVPESSESHAPKTKQIKNKKFGKK